MADIAFIWADIIFSRSFFPGLLFIFHIFNAPLSFA